MPVGSADAGDRPCHAGWLARGPDIRHEIAARASFPDRHGCSADWAFAEAGAARR
jgi:hypothetical protein